jgi:hypothetical protein
MPTASCASPGSVSRGTSTASARCMSSAAATAAAAWSGRGTGAPQKAITQSPMYLSIVPRCSARITRESSVRSVFISSPRAWGCICSDRVVNPRTSANITLSSALRPDIE